jgi:hypothetical protein
MSKVVVFMNLTLDGVMQAPGRPDEDRRGGFTHGGWANVQVRNPDADPVLAGVAAASMANTGALLLGRRTSGSSQMVNSVYSRPDSMGSCSRNAFYLVSSAANQYHEVAPSSTRIPRPIGPGGASCASFGWVVCTFLPCFLAARARTRAPPRRGRASGPGRAWPAARTGPAPRCAARRR